MQSHSSSHFDRCNALLQCTNSPLIPQRRMPLSVSYIRAVRKEISRTQRAIKLEESRVGTRLFHFSVQGCESGKVRPCLGHKTVISLITQHKTHSVIFSPQYYTGLESYDSLEVTVSYYGKGKDEGNVNGWALLQVAVKSNQLIW